MSNQSIAKDMLTILDHFSAGRVSATDVEDGVERAIQAMENVGSREIDRSRDLTLELVEASLSDDSEGVSLGPEVQDALDALRRFVVALGRLGAR